MRSRDIPVGPVRDAGSRSLTWLAFLACVLSFATPAHAHRASITQSTVTVSHDQTTVSYRLELEPTDTAVPRQSVWISHLTYCIVSYTASPA